MEKRERKILPKVRTTGSRPSKNWELDRTRSGSRKFYQVGMEQLIDFE